MVVQLAHLTPSMGWWWIAGLLRIKKVQLRYFGMKLSIITYGPSELPVDVVYCILEKLSIKDAALTASLSKTWREILRAYKIIKTKGIDYYEFSLSVGRGQYRELRDIFPSYATSELQIMKNLPVETLKINLALTVADDSRIDNTIALLSQIKAENLIITVQTFDSSRVNDNLFSYSNLLESRWLQSLTLNNCRLLSAGNVRPRLCTSLRRLMFSYVTLDNEVINNLACCCPKVDFIEFEYCTFLMETFKLSVFHMLKEASVQIKYLHALKVVDLRDCNNLKTFHYTSFYTRCLFSSNASKSIRNLTLSGSTPLFQDFTAAFPDIETAIIQAIGEFGDSFKAANLHLRELSLSVFSFLNDITVECPSLRKFKFSGDGCARMKVNCPNLRQSHWTGKFPTFLQQQVPSTCSITYTWFDISEINTSWFISLSEFLHQIGLGEHKINLCFGLFLHMAEFVLDDFGPKMQTSQLNNIHINLEMQYANTLYSAALVDGLVWSTHPTTLTTAGYSYNTIKYLYDRLETLSRDACCTNRFCNKFWWHNVENYQVYNKGGTEDIKGNLGTLLEMYDTHEINPCFKFLWRSSP